ncbi:aspartic peptidase domain-containing protein [Gorgonomyces haynaldii]|nr:aspartic peptidase domain-containing protein [Gorgonomyces haynaldii]
MLWSGLHLLSVATFAAVDIFDKDTGKPIPLENSPFFSWNPWLVATIGTPKQSVAIEIDTTFNGLWVLPEPCLPGHTCIGRYPVSVGQPAFNFNESSTFTNRNTTLSYKRPSRYSDIQCLNVSDVVGLGSMNFSRQNFGLAFKTGFRDGTHGRAGFGLPIKGNNDISNFLARSETPVMTLEYNKTWFGGNYQLDPKLNAMSTDSNDGQWKFLIKTVFADARSKSYDTRIIVDVTELVSFIPDYFLDVIVPKNIRVGNYPDFLGVDCNKVMSMPPVVIEFETGKLTLNPDQVIWKPSPNICASIFASGTALNEPRTVLGTSLLFQFKTHFDFSGSRIGFEQPSIKNPVYLNGASGISILGASLVLAFL